MNPLDRLAYSAADAIETSVATVPVPPWGVGVTSRFADHRRTLGYALTGAAAAVIAVLILSIVAAPREEISDVTPTAAVVTTVPTTVPQSVDVTVATTAPVPPDNIVPLPIPEGPERSVKADLEPPELVIVAPVDGAHVTAERAVVEGITEIGATLEALDGSRVDVDADGRWNHTVLLKVGENRVAFVATDGSGNQTEAAIVIIRDNPPRTTTTTRPDKTTTTTKGRTWEFTASNTYGECAEDPPFDVFHGSGQPGTIITVASDYGGGSTEVRENGEWELKVFFPESPFGEQFVVKVSDHTGAKKLFEFTRIEA